MLEFYNNIGFYWIVYVRNRILVTLGSEIWKTRKDSQ